MKTILPRISSRISWTAKHPSLIVGRERSSEDFGRVSGEAEPMWLDEEHDMIADHDAIQPEDWDEEMDGEMSLFFTFTEFQGEKL